MARSSRSLLACGILLLAGYAGVQVLTFVAAPAGQSRTQPMRLSQSAVAMQARGGGEYDVSDADIANFYAETITGAGGDPPKGTIVAELIVKFFHGEFTPQGFKRYSGLWKGPPPGTIGKKDIAIAMEGLKTQMKSPMFVTKGGVGYGVDETMKVVDDNKGYTWIAAEMSPGGLAIELFQSVPYGKRALFCCKKGMEDEMFQKINWDLMDKRIDTTLGGPQVIQR